MNAAVPSPTWLTVRDVRGRFRISKTTLWTWVAKGLLPRPSHLRQRAVWSPEEIAAAEARLVQPPPPTRVDALRAPRSDGGAR